MDKQAFPQPPSNPSIDSYHLTPTLESWLDYISSSPLQKRIPTLQPVKSVIDTLDLGPMPSPVVTIVGTNGKGSCCELLYRILRAAKRHVATFTSPHLLDCRERIRINGDMVSKEELVFALDEVDQARGDIVLSFFEFMTLAAYIIFHRRHRQQRIDYIILEAGIGGLYDPVNCFDADYSIISSIDYDHCHLLGKTLKEIAARKCGIFRANQLAVFSPGIKQAEELNVIKWAREAKANLKTKQRDYHYDSEDASFHMIAQSSYEFSNIPPCLHLDNVAACIALSEYIAPPLKLAKEQYHQAILKAKLPGRCSHYIAEGKDIIFDVAHNPHAAKNLSDFIKSRDDYSQKKHIAFLFILADKDGAGIVDALSSCIDVWHVLHMDHMRAQNQLQRKDFLKEIKDKSPIDISLEACKSYLQNPTPESDRIVVSGSFSLVAETMEQLNFKPQNELAE